MLRALFSVTAAFAILLTVGCNSDKKQASIDLDSVKASNFLSTYNKLENTGPATWRYLDPNNRLARYNKFIIDDIELTIDESAAANQTTYGALQEVKAYMRQALTDALEPEYDVVTAPAGDVAELRIALVDAFRQSQQVGISMQAEVIDAVSNVQIAALVEAQRGQNMALNRFWTESDAKVIMDDWAARMRRVVDEAHAAGDGY